MSGSVPVVGDRNQPVERGACFSFGDEGFGPSRRDLQINGMAAADKRCRGIQDDNVALGTCGAIENIFQTLGVFFRGAAMQF